MKALGIDKSKQEYEKSQFNLSIAKPVSKTREDKVKELKAKIENGDYELDAEKIADSILEKKDEGLKSN